MREIGRNPVWDVRVVNNNFLPFITYTNGLLNFFFSPPLGKKEEGGVDGKVVAVAMTRADITWSRNEGRNLGYDSPSR